MFGKKRKIYNNTVRSIIENAYDIVTDRNKNENFPDTFAFLRIIDQAVSLRLNENEAAMYVSSGYIVGIYAHHMQDEADALFEIFRLQCSKGIELGLIRQDYANIFIQWIENSKEGKSFQLNASLDKWTTDYEIPDATKMVLKYRPEINKVIMECPTRNVEFLSSIYEVISDNPQISQQQLSDYIKDICSPFDSDRLNKYYVTILKDDYLKAQEYCRVLEILGNTVDPEKVKDIILWDDDT